MFTYRVYAEIENQSDEWRNSWTRVIRLFSVKF